MITTNAFIIIGFVMSLVALVISLVGLIHWIITGKSNR